MMGIMEIQRWACTPPSWNCLWRAWWCDKTQKKMTESQISSKTLKQWKFDASFQVFLFDHQCHECWSTVVAFSALAVFTSINDLISLSQAQGVEFIPLGCNPSWDCSWQTFCLSWRYVCLHHWSLGGPLFPHFSPLADCMSVHFAFICPVLDPVESVH